jgi:hypothetical protein
MGECTHDWCSTDQDGKKLTDSYCCHNCGVIEHCGYTVSLLKSQLAQVTKERDESVAALGQLASSRPDESDVLRAQLAAVTKERDQADRALWIVIRCIQRGWRIEDRENIYRHVALGLGGRWESSGLSGQFIGLRPEALAVIRAQEEKT